MGPKIGISDLCGGVSKRYVSDFENFQFFGFYNRSKFNFIIFWVIFDIFYDFFQNSNMRFFQLL